MPKNDVKRHSKLVDDQWVQLKEPKSILSAFLLSIPLMMINFLISYWIISSFVPISLEDFGINMNSSKMSVMIDLRYIICIILMIVVHEFLHLICIPNFVNSDKTYIGVTLFGGYAYTEEVISKKRFILICILPYIIISIILPTIAGLLGSLSPLIAFFVLINAVGASVDILNLVLIIFQVPAKSSMTLNGMITYWRK